MRGKTLCYANDFDDQRFGGGNDSDNSLETVGSDDKQCLNQENHPDTQQIVLLTNENDVLKSKLKENDSALKAMGVKLENAHSTIKDYEEFSSCSSATALTGKTSLASKKIIELSKKVRELTSEVESYKSKCGRLQGKLKIMEEEKELSMDRAEGEIKTEPVDQVKCLNERLSAATLKLFEVKNANKQLKNELKTANRLLGQEIGESFTSIQQLSNAHSGWRGRAQQVLSLQQRVQELQDRMHASNVAEKDNSNVNMLRQIEMNRKHAQEQQLRELQTNRTNLDETRKRLDAARARSRVLENEIGGLKSRLATLLEKSSHDDQLIQALTCRLDSSDEKLNDRLDRKQRELERIESELKRAQSEVARERLVSERLKKTVEERDAEIKRATVRTDGGRCSNEDDDTRRECACRRGSTQESKIVNKVVEAERIRLLELVAVLNTRVDTTRGTLTKKELELKKERQKVAKLQATLAKIELSNRMEKSALYSKSGKSVEVAAPVDKIDNNEISKNQLELAEEHNLLLKGRLEALTLEKQMDVENFTKITEMTKRIVHDEVARLRNEVHGSKTN